MLKVAQSQVAELFFQNATKSLRGMLGHKHGTKILAQTATRTKYAVTLFLEHGLQVGGGNLGREPQGEESARGGAANEVELTCEWPA